jgi:heme o synthase
VLIPVALLPGAWGDAGVVYTLGALVLSLAYAAAAARFAWREDAPSARLVLFTSLAYLPLVFALVLFDPVVGVGLLEP